MFFLNGRNQTNRRLLTNQTLSQSVHLQEGTGIQCYASTTFKVTHNEKSLSGKYENFGDILPQLFVF